MSIQVVSENIILKNKNGKKVKAVLKVKQICFDPLLWSAIKEYAGIYDIGIKWEKKWSDGYSYYALMDYCPTIRAMTQKKFCEIGKATPEVIRRLVWKDLNTYIPAPEYKLWCRRNTDPNNLDNWKPVHLDSTDTDVKFLKKDDVLLINRKEKCLAKLHKLTPSFEVPDWIHVGAKVWWARDAYAWDRMQLAGKVLKITDTSIKIQLFEHEIVSQTMDICQDITTVYEWKENPKSKIVTLTSVKTFHKLESNTWETFSCCR
jgi:hypothetical protein